MRLLREFCHHANGSVVSFGNFDGVHLGHRKILSQVISLAEAEGLDSVVVTFEPHPLTFLLNKEDYIITSEKESLIRDGLDYLYIINFNKEFSEISAESFIEILHTKLRAKYIVTGQNCRFGTNGNGDLSTLKKYEKIFSYKTVVVDYIEDDSVVYSSTLVRKFLKEGNIEKANQILGRKYSIAGTVVASRGLGAKIGYPTINLKIDKRMVKPRFGVYSGEVEIDGQFYNGITNVGVRPTTSSGDEVFLEMHIFNFSNNLVNKKVRVFLYNFIRDEKKFNSIEDLKLQIRLDIESILNCIE